MRRGALYEAESVDDVPNGYFQQARRYFMEQAQARGYQVIDMAPYFFAAHKETGVRFESPTDAHWNGVAHKGAFEEVRDSVQRPAAGRRSGPRRSNRRGLGA